MRKTGNSTNTVSTVGLDKKTLNNLRFEAFCRLKGEVERFDADIASGGPQVVTLYDETGSHRRCKSWEDLQKSYRAFRELFVPYRARKRRSSAPWERAIGDEDEDDRIPLEEWKKQQAFFHSLYRKGSFTMTNGDLYEIAPILQKYQKHQSKWHKLSDRYREQAARYARTSGANKTEAARAAKKKWRSSEAGKAWSAKKREQAKAAKAKVERT